MDNTYYVDTVLRLYKKSPTEVEGKFLEFFLVPFSEKTLRKQQAIALKKFIPYLKTYIALKESPLTLEQIKQILLASEINSNVALQAFTKYKCTCCGDEVSWHNSTVPNLCDPCRERAAMNVIRSGVLNEIFKNEKMDEC